MAAEFEFYKVKPGEYRMEARYYLQTGGKNKNAPPRVQRFYFKKVGPPRFVELRVGWDDRKKQLSLDEKIF